MALSISLKTNLTWPLAQKQVLFILAWSRLLLVLVFHFLTIIIKMYAKISSSIFSPVQNWLKQCAESRVFFIIRLQKF